MNSYAYQYDYSQDYLMHYGVKGMKWGVVRSRDASYYRTKSNAAAAKVSSRKTRLGKSMANLKAYRNEVTANKLALNEKNENNILKNLDNMYGFGAAAAREKAAAKYFDRKSGYTKTRYGTSVAKANAYNAKSVAESSQKIHDSKSVKDLGKNYIDAVANRKVKTWSGRTTTTGEQYVDQMLTGGYYGLTKDIAYWNKTKPNKKK